MSAKSRWEAIDLKIKIATGFVGLCVALSGAFMGLEAWLDARDANKVSGCVVIPNTGQHYVESGPPGSLAIIHWKGINRLRGDCGKPVVVAKLVNGKRISHEPQLSIGEGVPLPEGVQNMSYGFYIPEDAQPGLATFQIWVSFPDAVGGSRTVMSPPVSFVIEKPEG